MQQASLSQQGFEHMFGHGLGLMLGHGLGLMLTEAIYGVRSITSSHARLSSNMPAVQLENADAATVHSHSTTGGCCISKQLVYLLQFCNWAVSKGFTWK